jgi:hypothetical protein
MGPSGKGVQEIRASSAGRYGSPGVARTTRRPMLAASINGTWAEDRGTPVVRPEDVDLPEMFFLLARLKAALCAAVDDRLRAEHGISLEIFDALTLMSERSGGYDEGALAAALALSPDRGRGLFESMLSGGYASRAARADRTEPAHVRVTLRGALVLSKASRTVDRELDRRIGSVLSPVEISELTDAVATMRQRLGRAEERISP